jgi:hypothetical protein
MIEHIEELRFDAKLELLIERKPLRQVKIAPDEIRTAQGVAAQIAELAVLRSIAAHASARARIDYRYERNTDLISAIRSPRRRARDSAA